MKKIIHHVRKQPEHIKRYILHIVMFACAVVLFLFWVSFLGTTSSNGDIQVKKMIQDLKPFSIIKNSAIEQQGKALESDLNTGY